MWFTVVAWFAISYTVLSLVYIFKTHHNRRVAKKRALQLLILRTTRNLSTSTQDSE